MTRGAWMCSRQYDDGLKIWFAPRENEKPFADSERAQKWRLSLASLLFFTVLLSDHLWFCAEAKFTGTGEKEQPPPEAPKPAEPPELPAGMGEPAPPAPRLLAPPSPSLPPSPGGGGGGGRPNGTEPRHGKAAFLGNATARPLETCPPPSSSSGQCFSLGDAEAVCRRRGGPGRPAGAGQSPAPGWDPTDFYLSFCNSYTLWELFAGLSNPDTLNCSLDVVLRGGGSCSQCVQAYQRYDQHAQEKYEEFEVTLQKYLQSEEYSVKSCPEDCKVGAPAVFPVPAWRAGVPPSAVVAAAPQPAAGAGAGAGPGWRVRRPAAGRRRPPGPAAWLSWVPSGAGPRGRRSGRAAGRLGSGERDRVCRRPAKICGAGKSWRARVDVSGHGGGPWRGSDGDSISISRRRFLWCHW
uniref:NALCN channel auxiliary factor 1 n=1 Tax=Aquila chrysaetos chrysaetos TaxID=223781 RepID=A0A663EFQ0_AQUCH